MRVFLSGAHARQVSGVALGRARRTMARPLVTQRTGGPLLGASVAKTGRGVRAVSGFWLWLAFILAIILALFALSFLVTTAMALFGISYTT